MANKEHGLLCTAVSVERILKDEKTHTRRVVKFPKWMDAADYAEAVAAMNRSETKVVGLRGPCDGYKAKWKSRYGAPGDLLWVKESWGKRFYKEYAPGGFSMETGEFELLYRASSGKEPSEGWEYALFMPRWASRITLRITSLRIERLQDISEEDAIKEGVFFSSMTDARKEYAEEWDGINGDREGCSWTDNPYVYVIGFERVAEGTEALFSVLATHDNPMHAALAAFDNPERNPIPVNPQDLTGVEVFRAMRYVERCGRDMSGCWLYRITPSGQAALARVNGKEA